MSGNDPLRTFPSKAYGCSHGRNVVPRVGTGEAKASAGEARMSEESQTRRQRALTIREAALGFSDGVSRTLIEMAEGLEADATRLEVAEREGSKQH